MSVARDRALVLRRFAFGETSLVAQVLARDHGRVHLLAKGAYRPKSRYYGTLDLFDTLELEWSAPRGELASLRSAELAERRHAIPRDLERYGAGLTVLELTSLAARPGQSSPELFELASEALDVLAAPGASPAVALAAFELRFLAAIGLAPALEPCAACGGEAPPVVEGSEGGEGGARVAFSAGAGGRLCPRCAAEARAAGRRVGTLPLAVLERASQLAQGGTRAGGFEPGELERIRDFAARFLEYQLEGRPRTYRGFLSVPNRNRPPP